MPGNRGQAGGFRPVKKDRRAGYVLLHSPVFAESTRKNQLNEWLEEDLLIRFRRRVLPIDTPVILVWGELTVQLERKGRVLPVMDGFIAATALRNDTQLVTRNEMDFIDSGTNIINPWAS